MTEHDQSFYLVSKHLSIRTYQRDDLHAYWDRVMEMPRVPGKAFRPREIYPVFEAKTTQNVGVRGPFTLAAFLLPMPNRLVLDMSFHPMTRDGGDMGLIYYTMQEYRRKGYMTEALRTVLPVLVAKYGVTKVTALIPPDNEASRKTAIKAGFRPHVVDSMKFVYKPQG